jgi:hypothetical protein
MLCILLLQVGSLFAIRLFFHSFGPNILMNGALVNGKGKILDFVACCLMLISFIIVLFLVFWILKYIKILFHKGPAYTISRQGITDYQFGLIGWHQIADIETNPFITIRRYRYTIFMPPVIHLPIPHVIISHKYPVQYFKGILRSFLGTRRLLLFVPLVYYECFENES